MSEKIHLITTLDPNNGNQPHGNPNKKGGFTPRAKKLGAFLGGAAIVVPAAVGLNKLTELPEPYDPTPKGDKDPAVCIPVGHQEYMPLKGMGQDDIVQDIGGAEHKGSFMNDPCYDEKLELVETVVGDDIVPQGKVYDLPSAMFPEDQVPEGMEIYTVDHK